MSSTTLLNPGEAQFLELATAVQASAPGIVSRTVLQSPDLRVVLFTFADGEELTLHTNRRRVLVQILGGACDFFFDSRWQRLAAGALLHLPPNHPHAVRAAHGAFSMLLTLGADSAEPSSPSLT